MAIQEFLGRLADHQIQLRLDGEQLCLQGSLDSYPDLMAELRRHETAIVDFLRRGADTEQSEDCPLSFAQERLWFLDQLVPGSTTYNIAAAYRLRGAISIPGLEWSLNEMILRHEALRTTISIRDGRPAQHVSQFAFVPLLVEDLTHSTNPDQLALAQLQIECERPFNLATGPLFRIKLLELGHYDHILVCCLHHIIFDGWSLRVFCRQLSRIYASYVNGQACSLDSFMQYTDYARWQTELMASPEGEKLWRYWQKQLSGELSTLDLPTDRPRPPVQTFRGASKTFTLNAELTQQIKELARAEGATLFMALLAAFQVLLHRLTNQANVLVGTAMSGRSRAEFEGIVGYRNRRRRRRIRNSGTSGDRPKR
jgi:hypothetical protein